MLLTAEQFSDILRNLNSDRSGKTAEKRREPRVGVRLEAVVTPLLPGAIAQGQRVTIRDLSRTGINIVCHGPMAKGTQFMVKMLKADQREINALYRVCNCNPLGPTHYAVGGSLLSISTSTTTKLAA